MSDPPLSVPVVKRCSSCGEHRALSEFGRRSAARDGLQSRCRSCCRRWYVENRTEHIANVRRISTKARRARRAKVLSYLLEHPCVDCGEGDPCVLEFDHVRGTRHADVGQLLRDASWARVEAEIAKCEIRCANCHRRATARRGDWSKASGHSCVETSQEQGLVLFVSA